jgi:predicted Zn finger-like uncharacterized protein
MALATKCPQCEALFRVVADQLKLRGGLVRCGQCRAVFDAIGSLTYVDDGALSQVRSQPTDDSRGGPPTVFASAEGLVRQATGPATTLRIPPVPPATLAGSMPPRIEPLPSVSEGPAVIRRHVPHAPRETAETYAHDPAGSAAQRYDSVPTSGARDEVPRASGAAEPAVGTNDATAQAPAAVVDTAVDHAVEEPPPSFTRAKRVRPRGFSIVYGGGTALLVLLAVLQFAVILRGQLMMHWPQARPMLDDLCVVFGCTVHWPTQADRLAVLGTELQSIPGTDVLELNAVVRNRAEFRQSLPAIEVTLTDARNQAVARKVFTPADYLASAGEPTARLEEGLAPGSDYTIRIFFEARGLAPAGFLVYPFYL